MFGLRGRGNLALRDQRLTGLGLTTDFPHPASGIGLFHMACEVIGNSVDLVLGGQASEIVVVVHADGSVEVTDDGPGLDLSDESVLEHFERLHSGPTADGHEPHVHLEGFGVGLVVVNSLSSRVVVTSRRGGHTSRIEWTQGGDHRGRLETVASAGEEGLTVRFWPDPVTFGGVAIPAEKIHGRLAELAALIPGLSFGFRVNKPSSTWDIGLGELARTRWGSPHYLGGMITAQAETTDETGGPIRVRMALGTAPAFDRQERMLVFCNFRPVTEECGLTASIRQGVWEQVGIEGTEGPADTPLAGVSVVATLEMLNPKFSGPTKGRIDDPVALASIQDFIARELRPAMESEQGRHLADRLTNEQTH